MSAVEIKIGGLGGQGVILAGMIIGRGASIFADRHASLTQSFGPEARGSACSAQVIVAPEPIEYPYVTRPDILVVMSQEACTNFLPGMAPSGTLLYESDLVKPGEVNPGIVQHGIPATRIAEELRRRMVANIVMVGFFAAVTDVVSADALRASVKDSVPPGTESLNLSAFERGYKFGLEALESSKTPAASTSR
jgi:2-oxoglutarate ferredoxin oxidoreductase subunit gamma